MAELLLPPDSSRRMRNFYSKIRDYSGYCESIMDKCLNHCCDSRAPMSYIEFAYLIDFLNSNHPEEYVKEILTKELMVSPTIGIDLKLDDSDFEQNYYCRILVDGRCLAYEARPFRCRIYMRDDKMGLCRPLRHIELVNEKDTNKSKRSIWNLNDSLDIPDEFKTKKRPITQGFVKLAREETLDFWIREFLKI